MLHNNTSKLSSESGDIFAHRSFAHSQFAHTKKANLACTSLLTNMISEDLGDFCGQNVWAKCVGKISPDCVQNQSGLILPTGLLHRLILRYHVPRSVDRDVL